MKENIFSISYVLLVLSDGVRSFRCDRRPYGSTTQASVADGRFKLSVEGSDNSYVPDQLYTVKISGTSEDALFSSFVISAEGDQKPDARNPRRLVALYPGDLRPLSSMTSRFSDRCLYSVEHTTTNQKPSVEVYWQAPSSGNGCVTLRAMVAVNEEVWYEDGTPLTVRLCEDMRQPDDVTPQLNYECSICDEAKYEVTFTGVWSRNTHPNQYPENDWLPKYSDLVGASHTTDFVLWSPGSLATQGLQDLAEYANSTQFESEIREKIGDGVRTMIKGKGHGYPKLRSETHSIFRADKRHHLVTTAVAFHPSPDWFLGVTRFELCQVDNTWLQERELNLYPWDAGTDSGVSYESANMATFPKDAINRVQMSSYDKNSPFFETDMKDLHPFGKLTLRLVKTYHRQCEESSERAEGKSEDGVKEQTSDGDGSEPEPSRYHNPDLDSGDHGREAPIETDPESPQDCPLSQWQEWSPCEGDCVGGVINGWQWRERYHLVDGVAVEKYDPDVKVSHNKDMPEVAEYCKENYDDFERKSCKADCSDGSDVVASRRLNPLPPGHPWNSKKRDLLLTKD